jgi:hypothetical protein
VYADFGIKSKCTPEALQRSKESMQERERNDMVETRKSENAIMVLTIAN